MPVDKQRPARILIVEDEPLIAIDLEALLSDAGFEIAGVARRLDAALSIIASGVCDGAILDANLDGVSSAPAALALNLRGTPFMVLSGYLPEQLREAFLGAPFIQKPYQPEQIVKTVQGFLLQARRPAATE